MHAHAEWIDSHAGAIVGAGILLVMILVYAINQRRKRIRRDRMSEAAQAMGLTFSPEDSGDLLPSLGSLNLFSHGHGKSITNILRARDGTGETAVFDYTYTVGQGKSAETRRQTVFLLRRDDLSLPGFTLAPERLGHKIGSLFGYQDIDIDSAPEFSSRCLLRGAEEERIRNLFSSYLTMYFAQHPNLNVEGGGGKIVVYRARRMVPPDGIRAFMDEGAVVARLFA